MTLPGLLHRKQLVVLGLNSGTSADGLDLAALRLVRRGRKVSVAFLAGSERTYPPAIRDAVLAAADATTLPPDQIVYLDQLLGRFYARTARQFIMRLAKRGIKVDAVASHGQTVRHLPKPTEVAGFRVHGTMQLGSPEQIATVTGLVTVGDFRQADVAAGNEGAPITVAAVARLFGHPKEARLIVNIGGMSNFFYIPAGANPARIRAADCGPGNSLSDLLSRKLHGCKYDHQGQKAAAGTPSERLYHLLTAESFFNGGTKSTGREVFGAAMADKMLAFSKQFDLKPDDLLATAGELTVRSIAARVRPLFDNDKTLRSLYLTGGGEHNRFFVRRLKKLLGGPDVVSIRKLGFDPKLVEAASYAVLGEACLRSEPLPTRFDGRPQKVMPVLGRIVQPPQKR